MNTRLDEALAKAMSLTEEEKQIVRGRFESLVEAEQEKVLFMLENEEKIIASTLE